MAERDDEQPAVRRRETIGADGSRHVEVVAGDVGAGESIVGVNLDDLSGSTSVTIRAGDVGPGASVVGVSLDDVGGPADWTPRPPREARTPRTPREPRTPRTPRTPRESSVSGGVRQSFGTVSPGASVVGVQIGGGDAGRFIDGPPAGGPRPEGAKQAAEAEAAKPHDAGKARGPEGRTTN